MSHSRISDARISDRSRDFLGFLSEDDTADLVASGLVIPSPQTVLVSAGVTFGEGVVLWPGVILQLQGAGRLHVGNGAVLYPGTRIVSGGAVEIGALVEIGEEGGFTIKADLGAAIRIGREARLLGGGSLLLANEIGDGAQIIGAIRCQNCTLGSGGSHRHEDPDGRGAVLKGTGVARGISLGTGQVIQAFGIFADAPVRMQSYFHPVAAKS